MANTESGFERFALWVERSKLKQNEVARLIGMHETQVSLILNRKRRPDLDNAAKIELVTGIPARAWAASPVADEASDDPTPAVSRA